MWIAPSLQKAILVPSGDQVGSASTAWPEVSFLWPVPSAFIVQMSKLPAPLILLKAILDPSGEKAGSRSLSELSVRRRGWFAPLSGAAFMT